MLMSYQVSGMVLVIAAVTGVCYCKTDPTTKVTTPATVPPTTEPPYVGLQCYSCHGVGPKSDCNNFTAYELAHKSEEKKFGTITLQTCAPPSNKTCYIITYTGQAGEVAQLRDCSDDVHFGFAKNKSDRYDILDGLPSNNETKCAWDGEDMVCLTKCNSGRPYCNGPYIAAASRHRIPIAMMFLNVFVVTWLLH